MKKRVLHMRFIGPGFKNDGWKDAWEHHGYEYHEVDWIKEKMKRGVAGMWDFVKLQIKSSDDVWFMHIHQKGILTPEVIKTIPWTIKKILYNIDCRSEEESEWIYRVAPYLNLCALSNGRDVESARYRGGRAEVVHSSFDPTIYHDCKQQIRRGVVFVGNNYSKSSKKFPLAEKRQSIIDYLHECFPAHFTCYGIGQKGGYISEGRAGVVYEGSEIAISMNNFEEQEYTSDRIWRAMACGSLVLAQYFPGIHNIFSVGEHLDVWHTKEELRVKIRLYLSSGMIDAKRMAANGQQFVLENHNLKCRVKQILEFL